MKKKHIIIAIIAIVIIASTIGFYFLKKNIEKENTKIEKYTINTEEKVFVNGIIAPEKTEDFYLDGSKGGVSKTFVKEGQVVKKEDSLFKYNNEEIVYSTMAGRVVINENYKSTGSPYISVEGNSFCVVGSINEKDYPKLKLNQEAEILILATNKTIKGKVASISSRPNTPDATSNISNYKVVLNFDTQENLTNGFHVQGTIKINNTGISIPATAVIDEKGKKYVYKIENKKLVKQEVTVSDLKNEKITVTKGLKEKDTIIAKPTSNMREGIEVE